MMPNSKINQLAILKNLHILLTTLCRMNAWMKNIIIICFCAAGRATGRQGDDGGSGYHEPPPYAT